MLPIQILKFERAMAFLGSNLKKPIAMGTTIPPPLMPPIFANQRAAKTAIMPQYSNCNIGHRDLC